MPDNNPIPIIFAIIGIIAAILCMIAVLNAEPFLTCDWSDSYITSYQVKIGCNYPINVIPERKGKLTRLNYDLYNLPIGTNIVRVRAVNTFNQSSWSEIKIQKRLLNKSFWDNPNGKHVIRCPYDYLYYDSIDGD